MLVPVILIIVSLLILFVGAEGLVRGGSSLGRRLGLSPLVIGLTVLAYGTSAPEMIVSVRLAIAGQSELAVGNVVGSNIFNIGIILGIAALICPIKVIWKVVKCDAPIMIAVALLGTFFLWDGRLGAWEAYLLLGVLLCYTGANLWFARAAPEEIESELESGLPSKSGSLWKHLAFLSGGLALLFLGSELLTVNASELARGLGVSEAVIGLTIVSAGTSMPELATSVIAAIRRQPDIAIGNIVGSNIFNILGILGVSGLVSPLVVEGIRPLDYGVMLAFSICLLPLLWSGLLLRRLEGALLLVGYLGYLLAVWPF